MGKAAEPFPGHSETGATRQIQANPRPQRHDPSLQKSQVQAGHNHRFAIGVAERRLVIQGRPRKGLFSSTTTPGLPAPLRFQDRGANLPLSCGTNGIGYGATHMATADEESAETATRGPTASYTTVSGRYVGHGKILRGGTTKCSNSHPPIGVHGTEDQSQIRTYPKTSNGILGVHHRYCEDGTQGPVQETQVLETRCKTRGYKRERHHPAKATEPRGATASHGPGHATTAQTGSANTAPGQQAARTFFEPRPDYSPHTSGSARMGTDGVQISQPQRRPNRTALEMDFSPGSVHRCLDLRLGVFGHRESKRPGTVYRRRKIATYQRQRGDGATHGIESDPKRAKTHQGPPHHPRRQPSALVRPSQGLQFESPVIEPICAGHPGLLDHAQHTLESLLDCNSGEHRCRSGEQGLPGSKRLEIGRLGLSDGRRLVRPTHVRRDGNPSECEGGTILQLGTGPGLGGPGRVCPGPLERDECVHQPSVADDWAPTPMAKDLPGANRNDTSSTGVEKPAMVAVASGTAGVPDETLTQGFGVVSLSETTQSSSARPTEMGDGGFSDQDGTVALRTGDDAGELFEDLAEALLSEADAKKTKKARAATQTRFSEWRQEQHMPEERVIQLGEILAYLNVKTDHRRGPVPAVGTVFAWMSHLLPMLGILTYEDNVNLRRAKRALYKRCPIPAANDVPNNVEADCQVEENVGNSCKIAADPNKKRDVAIEKNGYHCPKIFPNTIALRITATTFSYSLKFTKKSFKNFNSSSSLQSLQRVENGVFDHNSLVSSNGFRKTFTLGQFGTMIEGTYARNV
eukprot:Nk52_evm5s503 gene=Nk52_evmTU5s503